jgi:hypothetical protein
MKHVVNKVIVCRLHALFPESHVTKMKLLAGLLTYSRV